MMIPSPAALQQMAGGQGGAPSGGGGPQVPKEPTFKANFDIPIPVVEAIMKALAARGAGGMGVGVPNSPSQPQSMAPPGAMGMGVM